MPAASNNNRLTKFISTACTGIILLLFLFGCTYKIPINAKIGDIGVRQRIPLRSAVLFPASEQNYVHFATPQGRSDYTAEFPVGQALADATLQAFSQVFETAELVQNRSQAEGYDIVVKPEFMNMNYRFVWPRGHYTSLSVKVTFSHKGQRLFEKAYSSKEHGFPDVGKSGSGLAQVGQSVADGLNEIMQESVADMLSNDKMRRTIAALQGKTYAEPVEHDYASLSAETRPVVAALQNPVSAKGFGVYHALVIGNNDYIELPKLSTAVNDAKGMGKILESRYGFKVTLLINATRRDILIVLDKLRSQLTENDNLLVYFAGHGYYDEGADRGYWLPVDAAKDTTADWISNSDITDKLKAIHAKHVMVVADSCYSGAMTRSVSIQLREPDYYQRIATKRARTVLTSGGIEPVLDTGGGGHSVFSKVLLQALEDNPGMLDATELFNQIRRPIMVNSNQTPQYSDIKFAGHEGGDFIFIRQPGK